MANNNLGPLTGFGEFAEESFGSNGSLSFAGNVVPLSNKEPEVIDFYKSMEPDERSFFAAQVNEIRALARQNVALATKIKQIGDTISKSKLAAAGVGRLNAANKSFRGKNGPQIYLAPTKNGRDTEVRLNFLVDNMPFRVSHPSSFNTALAQMKEKRQNVSKRIGSLGKLLDMLEPEYKKLESQYNQRQDKIAALRMKLKKDLVEYRKRKITSLNEYGTNTVGSPVPSPYSREITEARQVQRTGELPAAPAASAAPAAKSSWWRNPFKKASKGGKTRRRSASRKTRKNRKNRRNTRR
jgi:hypothetical protein